MSDKGFIKIDRALKDWRYKRKPNYVALWVHLLISANYEKRKVYDVEVDRGSLLTSLENLAYNCGLSVQNVRTILKHLNGEEITIKSTNKNTLITILKYSDYQGVNKQTNKQANNQLTINQQTTNNKQETKETKETKEYIYGEYSNVHLSDAELEKLKVEFPNDYQERIEQVSSYCASTGKKYKNYLATIRNWARKEKPKVDSLPTYDTSRNVAVSEEEKEELLRLMGKA